MNRPLPLKLFAVYVGGHVEGGHLEVHDMRFVVGEAIESCYPQLRAQWWGIPKTLHLDGWIALESVDGYDVRLETAPPQEGARRLFFVNLGGYTVDRFEEDHENLFVVAQSEKEASALAKSRALRFRKGVRDNTTVHKDTLLSVDTLLDLGRVPEARGLHLHLHAREDAVLPPAISRYVPISEGS